MIGKNNLRLATISAISLVVLGVSCKQTVQPQSSVVNVNQTVVAEVTLIPGTDNSSWLVNLNNEAVGTIAATTNEAGITVDVFKQTATAAYIGVTPDGLGGYILYGGPHRLYRLDLGTKEIKEIIGQSQVKQLGFIGDISADENWLAYVNQADENITIDLLSLSGDGAIHQIMVPAAYQQVGDVKFSPDGNQLAYAAAVGEPDSERGVVFTAQLGTDSQKQITEVAGNYFVVTGWKDNQVVYHAYTQ